MGFVRRLGDAYPYVLLQALGRGATVGDPFNKNWKWRGGGRSGRDVNYTGPLSLSLFTALQTVVHGGGEGVRGSSNLNESRTFLS